MSDDNSRVMRISENELSQRIEHAMAVSRSTALAEAMDAVERAMERGNGLIQAVGVVAVEAIRVLRDGS